MHLIARFYWNWIALRTALNLMMKDLGTEKGNLAALCSGGSSKAPNERAAALAAILAVVSNRTPSQVQMESLNPLGHLALQTQHLLQFMQEVLQLPRQHLVELHDSAWGPDWPEKGGQSIWGQTFLCSRFMIRWKFMIQGGGPSGTEKGGQSIWCKSFKEELNSKLLHSGRGAVSMANSVPHTNGFQFFILHKSANHLNFKHAVFGMVVGGLTTLAAMEKVPVDDDDWPLEIKITNVRVFMNPYTQPEAKRECRREESC